MDRIVSAVYYEGKVLVFTSQGKIYELVKDGLTGGYICQLIQTLELR